MTRLPDDRDMEQAVRSRMRDDDERPADRNRQVGRIMGRVDETRQRRGPWRAFPFWRGSAAVDETDDDLVVARTAAVAPALMGVVSALALVAAGLALLTLRPLEAPVVPAVSPSASPVTWLEPDPSDVALLERLGDIWGVDAVDISEVMDVYASDARHTALFTDSVDRITGSEAIAHRIMVSEDVGGSGGLRQWVRVRDAGGGDHRYMATSAPLGMACIYWIGDGQITRHDCILPWAAGAEIPNLEAPPPSAAREREAFLERFRAGWGGDRAAWDEVVSPDVVHFVTFDNHTVPHYGRDELWSVARQGLPTPAALAPAIDLPAPEGQRRFTDFSSNGGGTLCVFWTVDGQLERMDCIVPTLMSIQLPPATPQPSGA